MKSVNQLNLTSREMELTELIEQGLSNKTIGVKLYIDTHTVETHINSIYSKLRSEYDTNGKHLRCFLARIIREQKEVNSQAEIAQQINVNPKERYERMIRQEKEQHILG